MPSLEIEPLNPLVDGRYGQPAVCQCKHGNKWKERDDTYHQNEQEVGLDKELSGAHQCHRDNERCSCPNELALKCTFPFSVVLNILLVSLLAYTLKSVLHHHHDHYRDKHIRSGKLSEGAVCLSCVNVDAAFLFSFRIQDMQVVTLNDGKICCLRKRKYAQVLMKIIQIAQRNRHRHTILKPHLAGIYNSDRMANFLPMKNVRIRTKSGIKVRNGTIRIDLSGLYNIYVHLTIHWGNVLSETNGSKNIKLSLNRRDTNGKDTLVLQNNCSLDRSVRELSFRPLTMFESVWLQGGDTVYLDINEPSMIYRSCDSNFISLIT